MCSLVLNSVFSNSLLPHPCPSVCLTKSHYSSWNYPPCVLQMWAPGEQISSKGFQEFSLCSSAASIRSTVCGWWASRGRALLGSWVCCLALGAAPFAGAWVWAVASVLSLNTPSDVSCSHTVQLRLSGIFWGHLLNTFLFLICLVWEYRMVFMTLKLEVSLSFNTWWPQLVCIIMYLAPFWAVFLHYLL